jgi:hypothetical protein
VPGLGQGGPSGDATAATIKYYRRIATQPRRKAVEAGRRALQQYSQKSQGQPVAMTSPRAASSGLIGLVSTSLTPTTKTPTAEPPVATARQTPTAPAPATAQVVSEQPEKHGLLYRIFPSMNGGASTQTVAETPAPATAAPSSGWSILPVDVRNLGKVLSPRPVETPTAPASPYSQYRPTSNTVSPPRESTGFLEEENP